MKLTHHSGKLHHTTLEAGSRLRLLSYNIQVGIGATRLHHYLTHSWKHFLPHEDHFHNLDRIASLIKGYDIVGLQETDAGSFRSSFVSQPRYLAERAGYAYFHVQTNRNFGHIARHSNSLLSQLSATELTGHRLPGVMPGRGVLVARYGEGDSALVVLLLHLALSKKARMRQLEFVAELVNSYRHVVVMGDLNCHTWSDEISTLLDRTGLHAPTTGLRTFPSWRPRRELDHFLVSPTLEVVSVEVLPVDYSDHLPVSIEIVLPETIMLSA